MDIKDVRSLISQDTIPTKVQQEVIAKAEYYIRNEYEVEVIVSIKEIYVDVYSKGVWETNFFYALNEREY